MASLIDKIPAGNEEAGVSRYLASSYLSTPMRKRLAENAEVAQRRLTGREITTATPLSAEVLAAVEAVEYRSHIEQKLAEANFQQAEPAAQLALLGDLVRTENLAFSSRRTEDFVQALEGIRVNQGDAQQVEAFNTLVDGILAKGNGLKEPQKTRLYQAAQVAWSGQSITLEPLGSLATLHQAVGNFVHAGSREEAEEAARVIQQASSQIDITNARSVIASMDWPNFTLPGKDKIQTYVQTSTAGSGVQLPWASHVAWAVEGIANGSSIPAALIRLGVNDTRLPFVRHLAPSSPQPILEPRMEGAQFHGGGFNLRQLRFNPQLEIVGVQEGIDLSQVKDKNQLIALERQRLESVTQSASTALETVDWGGMESNFFGFVQEHAEFLTPEKSVIDGPPNPFAEAFTEKLSALVEQDPDTYAPLAHQFFTGKRPGALWVDTKPVQGSMPEMIREYNRMHGLTNHRLSIQDMPLGISPDHPYMRFVMDDQHRLFSEQEKTAAAGEARYLSADSGLSSQQRWTIQPQQILSIPPIKSVDQLTAFYNTVSQQQQVRLGDPLPPPRRTRFVMDALQAEILRFLQDNPDLELSREQIASLRSTNIAMSISSSFAPEVSDILSQKVAENLDRLRVQDEPPQSVITHYNTYKNLGLMIERPDLRDAFEAHIKQQFLAVEEPAQRVDLAKRLLYSNVSVRDGELQKMAVSGLADGLAQIHGRDEGDPAYAQTLQREINELTRKIPPATLLPVLVELGDKIEAQRELSYYMRDKLKEKAISQQPQAHLVSGGAEALIDTVNADESLRQQTIAFLRGSYSEGTAKQYLQSVSPALESLLMEAGESQLTQKLMGQLGDAKLDVSETVKLDRLQGLHQRFWSMHPGARVALMEKIMFLPGQDDPKSFEANKKAVLDAVMPPPSTPVAEPKKNLMQRLAGSSPSKPAQGMPLDMLADAIFDVTPLADQRLFLTGMMFGGEPSADKGKSANRAVSQGLIALGPAGVKLAQAIDGYEKRKGAGDGNFADSKKMSQKPACWDVHELMEKVPEPENPDHQTKRVGKVLGAGAYGVTIRRERNDGQNAATTILPDHVRERAEYEFNNFEKAIVILVNKRPETAPMLELIKEARRMAAIETDMDIAAKQAIFASENYDGLEFEIRGRRVVMSAAQWMRHGTEYKETEMVKGEHFNDLPIDTPEALEIKEIAGEAGWGAEVYLRAKGKPNDHDRHGAQQKIEVGEDGVIYIRNFDFGAMDTDPPTTVQKQAFVKTLYGAAVDSVIRRKPVAQALTDRIKQFSGDPEAAKYLSTLGRATIATSDFEFQVVTNEAGDRQRVDFVDNDKKLNMLSTIFVTGNVDQDIEQQIDKSLGLLSGMAKRQLRKASDGTVKIIDNTGTASPHALEKPVQAAKTTAQETHDQPKAEKKGPVNAAYQQALHVAADIRQQVETFGQDHPVLSNLVQQANQQLVRKFNNNAQQGNPQGTARKSGQNL